MTFKQIMKSKKGAEVIEMVVGMAIMAVLAYSVFNKISKKTETKADQIVQTLK